MSDIVDSLERAAGRLYTAFVMRDLTFFISGAAVIVVLDPSILKHLGNNLCLNSKFYWITFLAFLAISYVLGIILQEAIRTFMEPLSRKYIKCRLSKSESKDELVVRLERIIKNGCSDHTIRGLERILFLKQVGGTQFSALLTILIIFIIRIGICRISAGYFVLLISGLLISGWMYLNKSLQQEKILTGLEHSTNIQKE
jgi:hypothetical protein